MNKMPNTEINRINWIKTNHYEEKRPTSKAREKRPEDEVAFCLSFLITTISVASCLKNFTVYGVQIKFINLRAF